MLALGIVIGVLATLALEVVGLLILFVLGQARDDVGTLPDDEDDAIDLEDLTGGEGLAAIRTPRGGIRITGTPQHIRLD